jgi:hypothetical protein
MPRFVLILAAAAAIVLGGALSSSAQITRGAATIPTASENFSPVVKAACGPYRGRYCGPFHHLVCNRYGRRCRCVPC